VTLQKARTLVGISQIRLDDLAGLTRGTTADLERGKNQRPAHETVTKIIRALRGCGLSGLTAEDLFPVPAMKPSRRKAAVAS
jgi:predicted transcriptional regulator